MATSFSNLVELLEVRAEQSNVELTFLRLGGRRLSYTYSQILEAAQKVAAQLQILGLPEGAVVALFLPTGFDFCAAFFGVQLAGGIPVSIYPPLKLQNISQWRNLATHQMRDVGVQLALTDSAIHKILGEPVLNAPVKFGSKVVSDLIAFTGANDKFVRRSISPIAFLQFSSGTTGHSKAVTISHENALTNADAILDGFHIDRKSCVTVSWLPLYHDMGLIGAFISSIVADGKLYLINPEHFVVDPLIWLRAISEFKANITVAPNFAYGLCCRRLASSGEVKLNLDSLRFALCGAEMIHPQTLNEFYAKFSQYGLRPGTVVPVYGLAEATLAVTFNEMDQARHPWKRFDRDSLQMNSKVLESDRGIDIVSVGRPLKNIRVEIRGEKGQSLGEGFFGKIWIKSPAVMMKYFNNPKLTDDAIVDGWLNSGDNGFIWQGELYIGGRAKEIIIIRGQNYDPTLIERSLLKIPELREGCAVAFSTILGDSSTEELVVVSEVKKGIQLTADLIAKVTDDIGSAILEDHVLTVKAVNLYRAGTLPRTSSGKIKRSLCKKLWQLKVLGENGQHVVPVEIIVHFLRSQIAHIVGRFRRFK